MNHHTIDKDHITFLHYLEWIETTHRINPEQALPVESAVIMFNSWQHATYHINENADTETIREWMVKNRQFHDIMKRSSTKSKILYLKSLGSE